MASEGKEIRQLARYQVKAESLERCLAAIHEFVAYVRANESGTLRYDVWQENDDPRNQIVIIQGPPGPTSGNLATNQRLFGVLIAITSAWGGSTRRGTSATSWVT